MKIFYGILIGLVLLVSISAIRPSREQKVLSYSNEYPSKIKNDLNYLFKSGFRVVSMVSYGDFMHNDGYIIIILEK